MKPLPEGTLQLYVVPAGTIPLVVCVGDDTKLDPLQMAATIGVIMALGLRLTVMVKGLPLQPPVDFGVTIYVAVVAILDVLISVAVISAAFVPDKFPVNVPDGAGQL